MWKIQIFIFVEAVLLTLAAITILSIDFSRFVVLMVLFLLLLYYYFGKQKANFLLIALSVLLFFIVMLNPFVIAAILFVLGTGFFIPIVMKYLSMGGVTKIPSLIVICFVILSAIICLFSGIILSTLVQQHKQNFEFQLQEVNMQYKRLFPEG